MQEVYCQIRKEWVAAQPEELVRQALVRRMVDELGYPSSLITVEKSLQQLPHIEQSGLKLPLRRADILVFAKGIHPQHDLYPLLMIECKAIPLNGKVISQVTGYNHYVQAVYVAVANGEQVQTGWYNSVKKGYQFVEFLPSYSDLLSKIQ